MRYQTQALPKPGTGPACGVVVDGLGLWIGVSTGICNVFGSSMALDTSLYVPDCGAGDCGGCWWWWPNGLCRCRWWLPDDAGAANGDRCISDFSLRYAFT